MKKTLLPLWIILGTFVSAGMVKDLRTGLMWEDSYHSKETKITHPRAVVYCRELKLGGYDDWRLPTIQELLSIVDYSKEEPAILGVFDNVDDEGFYWTSTLVAGEDDEYWGVNFKHGESSRAAEYYDRYVRCVRNVD